MCEYSEYHGTKLEHVNPIYIYIYIFWTSLSIILNSTNTGYHIRMACSVCLYQKA